MMIYKLLYLNQTTGEHGLLPDYGITNTGGTSSPTFTVNGKGLLFKDGTSSDGLGNTTALNLQFAYNSGNGIINLSAGKNFVINSVNSEFFNVNADTGDVVISNNLEVQGLINNINLTQFLNDFTTHITPSNVIKHTAAEISAAGPYTNISGTNVEEALSSIDSQLSNVNSSLIKTWEHNQPIAATSWVINHNKNSTRPTVSIYDANNDEIYADEVHIVDANNISVSFNSPQDGRAIILMF